MKLLIKKYKNLIPILFLGLICLWTIFDTLFIKVEQEGETFSKSFNLGNILAFLVVGINVSVYFFARKYFKYSVLTLIVVGFFGVFLYGNFTITVTLNSLTFDGLSFYIGIVYIILNFKRFKAKVLPKKLDPNVEYLPDQEKIEEFKYKYRNKEKAELISISDDKRYVKEAKLAALEIISQMEK